MIIVLAIDALEYEKVQQFGCDNLKQQYYGKTDISEFSEPRTMVLWSSFITGMNKEKVVLSGGNNEMWSKRWNIGDTLFSSFKDPIVLDLPGFSYDLLSHEKSRNLLRRFFEAENNNEKEAILKEYNKDAIEHHKKIKEKFLEAIKQRHDIVLGYFSAIDVIGHLNFGNGTMMKTLYREMDELAAEIKNIPDTKLIVLSDHGMKPIGAFGDHSNYGFWSTSFDAHLSSPKITDFFKVIQNL